MNSINWNNKDNNWTIDDKNQNKQKDNKNNKKVYSINSDELLVKVGESYNIKEKGKYQYEIEDSDIAKVDKNGKITGLKSGNTSLIITNKDDVIVINVNVYKEGEEKVTDKEEIEEIDDEEKNNEIKIESISISNNNVSLLKGNKLKLNVVIKPVNATNQELKWESNNNNVIVDSTGTILANKVGKSTITVKTIDGKSSSCEVSVIEEKIQINSISLNVSEKSLQIGENIQLTTTISPTNAEVSEISWNSSNPSVASVTNGKVNALAVGTTDITVKTSNGKSAICKITVKEIPANSISLNKTNISLNVNDTFQLVPTILPNNVSNSTVSWISSDTNIATVDKNGLIKAKSSGSTVIIASTLNGKKVTCKVEVKEDASKGYIYYAKTNYTCKVGDKIDTKITASGAQTSTSVKGYGTDNTSIATVNAGWADGTASNCSNCRIVHIVCKSVGTTKITATSTTGATTSSTVTVTK